MNFFLDKHAIWLLLIGCLSLYLYGSFQVPLLGPDEPRYSQVARQMYESGNYLVPYLQDFPWFEKPVLLYWLMCISYALFGVNEFAARLPSALTALATVIILYQVVRQAAGQRQGIATALILGTSAFFIGFSHAATFDMLLTFCVSAAFGFFLMYEFGKNQIRFLRLFYLFAGISVLAKGFVAWIIIGIVLSGYFTLTRKWSRLAKDYRIFSGTAIGAGIPALWLVPISLIHGKEFWNDFFLQHHLMRYTTSQFHRSETVFFYIPILMLGVFPWMVAPFIRRPECRSVQEKELYIFALCWLFLPLIFFSLSRSKLPGYILPVCPAFAILSGFALTDILDVPTRRLWIFFGTQAAVFTGALFWGLNRWPLPDPQPVYFLAPVMAIITIASLILLARGRIAAASVLPFLLMTGGLLLATHVVYPASNWDETRTLAAKIQEELTGKRKLLLYNIYDFGTVFYTAGKVELDPKGYFYEIRNYQDLYIYLLRNGEAFVLAGNEELDWIKTANFWRVVKILRGSERSIIHLQKLPKR